MKNLMKRLGRKTGAQGFTLMEVLVVLTIMALLVGLSGAAIQGLTGAGTVNRNINDLSGALDLARTYARANHTYVRVALGQVPASATNPTPSVAVLLLYSSDGQLDAASSSDMANAAQWPLVKPLFFLNNLVFSDSLNGTTPDTSSDSYPSQTDIGPLSITGMPTLSGVSFTAFIQFDPSGEAQVSTTTLARNIKIGLDKPSPQQGKNPFILRLSGMNGTIVVIRKEDM